jgi:uncharacterized protein (DUF1800 family)
LTPDGRTIRCGATLNLYSHVENNSDQTVTWLVNGIANGNATVGTVTSVKSVWTYTAPAELPNPATATITATSAADPTKNASITVTLENPIPSVTSVTPNPVNPGPVTLTLIGTGFAKGATVYFAGAPLLTTWVSDLKLMATGTVAMPVGRLAAIKVTNPNPGTATSTPVSVPVRVANEKMDYTSAVRFLQMTTFGPTPADVANLQTVGRDAWLTAQFAQPASAWPDPNTPTEGVSRLQSAFFQIALTGNDQLRQRVSLALAEVMVASAVKDMTYAQMVTYQRLLGDAAFGKYRDLLGNMTLNPAMGFYLDMVNNDKANPAKGTAANENYARESMQLFSLGLVQLNPDGSTITGVGGAPLDEYDQSTVTQMAKVMTGWTYAPEPGFASNWPNPEYDLAPMIAFESHHDATAKQLNLPIPCTIAAGGTALGDLNQALDCIAKQSNVAPFIAYRLIQRLVKSNPSATYVSAVASAFGGGNLQAAINAALTNSEASTEGTGKLNEPFLYATGLLRALNATVTGGDGMNGQTAAMAQTALSPGSVFSYFSPFYRVSGMPAPEFQIMNATSAIGRANYAYRVVTNGINGEIKVDLTNLEDLANNPSDLVEAINQALFRGEMDTNERAIILAAASGSTNLTSRVRSAIYAAAAAPQYEVAR